MAGWRRSGRLSTIQSDALDDVRMTPAMLRVLLAIGTYADSRTGLCYPKQQAIAERFGTSRQAVSRQLRELARLGYVEIIEQRRGANGQQTASLYRVVFDYELPLQHRRAAQPDVALSAQPDVDSRATSGGCTSNVPLERSQERTSHQNDTTPGPSASGGELAPRRERRNGQHVDDAAPTPTEPLARVTPEDAALWEQSRETLRADMTRANWEMLVEPLEPLGRSENGGLTLRSPPLDGITARVINHIRRALYEAGDECSAHASIKEDDA